jgi:hypothetical protein
MVWPEQQFLATKKFNYQFIEIINKDTYIMCHEYQNHSHNSFVFADITDCSRSARSSGT